MKKEFRSVSDGHIQITVSDERWYSREGLNAVTGLPEIQFVPSVTWIAGHYPKGRGFWMWLAEKGWDEAEAIKAAAGDKGSRVHHAIVDLLDGHSVPMEAKYAGSDGDVAELTLEEYECLMGFQRFWEACEPVTLAREVTVFNAEHNYAGTLDWLGLIRKPKGAPPGLYLLDWKTSKDVWPEHELQVSGYAHSDYIREWAMKDAPIGLELQGMGGGLHLGILQVGYRRNKAGWKLTPVEDKFDLFLAAQKIWAYECEGAAPSKKDYPLSLTLAKP